MKPRHLATIDAAVDAWLGILRYFLIAALVLASVAVLWAGFGPTPASVPCYSNGVCSTSPPSTP